MSKLNQTKIPLILSEDNVLKIVIDQGVIETEHRWKLVRERDGLTKRSADVMWLEFDEAGKFKSKHSQPGIGRSLIMSPFNDFFTWQTTGVTEILACTPDCEYVKFKTTNSTYELSKE